jgi:murein DD-endopeptidase MepM/ murein hydrolase activator NlpD
MRILVVRDAKPVREIRVHGRTVWRLGAFGVITLWCVPLAALAGIAAQARDYREQLAGDVRALAARTARLSSNVIELERSIGVAVKAGAIVSSVRGDSSSEAGGEALPNAAPAAMQRADAAESWVSDLERRVRTVGGALRSRLRSLPIGRPIAARLSSGFGWRADPFGGGGADWHPGLDIPARYGTPVRATADGVVEFAQWRNGYGLAVGIRHADGFTTLFGHLSAATVRPGQSVTRDAIVGRVGNEGRSTGPHVHYEVRRWGKPVDPGRVRLTFPQPSTSAMTTP